jgi:DNA-binding MarR family transcriptional regulator
VDRQALIHEVLDELTLHGPGGIMRAMRKWPTGPVSLAHLHALAVLASDGPIPMGAIAEALDTSQASVTGFVDRMEQRGLVERQRDADDRRIVRVGLTDAGRAMIETLAAERRERLTALLASLDDDDLAALLRGNRALRLARERLLQDTASEPHG